MNVTIDAMQSTPASRTLWWLTLVCVVAGGLAMRLATIDRGTPGLGAFVYFGLLAVMMVVIALPTSIAAALAWHYATKRSWRFLVSRIRTARRAQWFAVAAVAVTTVAFTGATGRLPKWHVWMSVAAVNALVAWRIFEVVVHELQRNANPASADAVRSFEHVATVSITSFVKDTTRPRAPAENAVRSSSHFASDERARKAHWRNRPIEMRI
jgi:hypothetical protein